jgi:glutamine cyclotransferase
MQAMKSNAVRIGVCVLFGLLPLHIGSCTSQPDDATLQHYGYRIVKTYPHQRSSFTQGLVMDHGIFYEGTGNYGESYLLKVDPNSGDILKQVRLSPNQFGNPMSAMSMIKHLSICWIDSTIPPKAGGSRTTVNISL